jgi:hypothetical protein
MNANFRKFCFSVLTAASCAALLQAPSSVAAETPATLNEGVLTVGMEIS